MGERLYSGDLEVSMLVLIADQPTHLALKSDEGSSDVRINACRVDCRERGSDGTIFGEDANIQARLISGEWQDIYGWSNALQLGTVSAGGTVDFELKAVVDTIVALAIRAKI